MFDIGWSELVVIGVVALIAIGPKELPGVLRTVGQYMGKIRRMAAEFQGQFQEAMREAEMADLKKQVDEMTESARSFTSFNPMEPVKKEIEGATNPDSWNTASTNAASTNTATDAPAPESAATPPTTSQMVSPELLPAAETAPKPPAPQPEATPSPAAAPQAEPPAPREAKSGGAA